MDDRPAAPAAPPVRFAAAGPARPPAARPDEAAGRRLGVEAATSAASAVSARFADRSAFLAAATSPRGAADAPTAFFVTVLRARAGALRSVAGFDAVLFFPVASLAAAPVAVAVVLPDADFFSAVFFATISRPLHIL
ncbi:hypothetical protein A4V12_24830 [Streptomyces noursei]|nr:hypothetical protein A4V12_24830 [Streptomyces noursei]